MQMCLKNMKQKTALGTGNTLQKIANGTVYLTETLCVRRNTFVLNGSLCAKSNIENSTYRNQIFQIPA